MATKEVEEQIEQGLAPKEKEGKLMWRNLPLKELQEVCKVFNDGASERKYKGPFTYRNGDGLPEGDMFDANMRHLERIQAGELCAKDSGCLHWAHIAADALMQIAKILIEQERLMKEESIQESDPEIGYEEVENFTTYDHLCKTITFPKGTSEMLKLRFYTQNLHLPESERGKWRELET